ncbi:MAG TPA: STAS domain-containing protein [Solirubrobacterales bacterium]|nr:STAS domain-containing protein [Solirubrobacterales bacterium]
MEATPIKRAVVLTGRRIRLIGDFDRASVPAVRRWLAARSGTPVVVDLSECEFLDGGVLALLVEEADGAGRDPRRFSIVGAGGQAARLLAATGVTATESVDGGEGSAAAHRVPALSAT